MNTLPLHGPLHNPFDLASTSLRRKYKTKPLEQRFWSKVQKQEGDGCWLWTGAITAGGYGSFAAPITGKTLIAHRVSYTLTYGPIADDLCVLHKCDVRNCVRPDHLFLGDYGDNARDAFSKGRRHIPPPAIGEKNYNAKLTTSQVRCIKQMLLENVPLHDIASQFHVNKQTIIEIRAGRNWKHVIYEQDDKRDGVLPAKDTR